jgi:hypothetical protein
MADDFSGLKSALSSTMTKMVAASGPLYNREADGALFRAFIALFKSECAAAGVILP